MSFFRSEKQPERPVSTRAFLELLSGRIYELYGDDLQTLGQISVTVSDVQTRSVTENDHIYRNKLSLFEALDYLNPDIGDLVYKAYIEILPTAGVLFGKEEMKKFVSNQIDSPSSSHWGKEFSVLISDAFTRGKFGQSINTESMDF